MDDQASAPKVAALGGRMRVAVEVINGAIRQRNLHPPPPPPQDSATTTPLESSSPSSPIPLAFKIAATAIAGPWTPTLYVEDHNKVLV
ncbi:hypothetical protein CC80DRAFT_556275 [Byssothecium circinans]|uniref:Uncharacterized protein n=1 Tax=Byssothecium circinans TaxID=147558 RepID=A0A6A5T8G0_9PLEO|nr:hypothetical protein CC80DRAFT_556275 [Byssothecium circinans]